MRRAATALTCSLAALSLLATGCGSGGSHAHTATAGSSAAPTPTDAIGEIKASGELVAADIESSSFERACQGFTQATRAKFAAFPQGCAGALSLARAAGHSGAREFGQLFRRALLTRVPRFQIKGYEALNHGVVEARYEEGRWRFEGQATGFGVHRT